MKAVLRRGTLIFGWAIALGVAGDLLFNEARWGVNVTVWLLALFAVAAYLRASDAKRAVSLYLCVAIALSCLAPFRDAVMLRVITVIAILGAISFATLSTDPAQRLLQTTFTYLGRVFDTLMAVFALFGDFVPSVLASFDTNRLVPNRMTVRIVRGSILAFAALMLFGSLLVSADAVFERIVVETFSYDLEQVFDHTSTIVVCSLLAATMLYVVVVGPPILLGRTMTQSRVTGYAVETNILFGAVNALFAAFIVVQIGYFFGGHERILQEAGLTYAEYAQSGFFEIATIAVLSFGMVLVCDSLVAQSKHGGRRAFNVLAALHVGLVGVLIASAFHRLTIYIETYGLTELRFYVATAIIWIAVASAGLIYTILTAKRAVLPRFLSATLFLAVFVLHAINPAGIIVRTNLARDRSQVGFDVDYALSMSADAVPSLVRGLTQLPASEQTRIASELQARWKPEPWLDYRSWNFSRWHATRIVGAEIESSGNQ